MALGLTTGYPDGTDSVAAIVSGGGA